MSLSFPQAAGLCFLLLLLISTCNNATEKPQDHVHGDQSACEECINNQLPLSLPPPPPPPPPPSLPLPPPIYQGNCPPPPPAAPAGDCCPQNLGPPLPLPPPPPVYIMEPSAASELPLMKSHSSLFSCFVVSLPLLITFVFQVA